MELSQQGTGARRCVALTPLYYTTSTYQIAPHDKVCVSRNHRCPALCAQLIIHFWHRLQYECVHVCVRCLRNITWTRGNENKLRSLQPFFSSGSLGLRWHFRAVYEPLCLAMPHFPTLPLVLASVDVVQNPKRLEWSLKSYLTPLCDGAQQCCFKKGR